MIKNANTTPKTRNSTIEIVRKIVLYLGSQSFTSLMTYLHISIKNHWGPLCIYLMYLLLFQCIYYVLYMWDIKQRTRVSESFGRPDNYLILQDSLERNYIYKNRTQEDNLYVSTL